MTGISKMAGFVNYSQHVMVSARNRVMDPQGLLMEVKASEKVRNLCITADWAVHQN